MSSDSFLFSLLNLDRKTLFQHYNIYCDVCSRSITGIRRKCLTCADIDVCNDCYLRGAHLSQIKFGHNPSSCVFVEIHTQEQTDEFNNWMKGRVQPTITQSIDIPTISPPDTPGHPTPFPSPVTPNPVSQHPQIPLLPGPFNPSVPMIPIPTPRRPQRPLFDPQIFPIHPTFPDYRYRFDTCSRFRDGSCDDTTPYISRRDLYNSRDIDENRFLGNEESVRDQLNNNPLHL